MSSSAIIDLRQAKSAREVISHPRGGLFPVQDILPSGEIITVSRGGAGHLGQNGRLDITRSRDAGLTWTPPAVLIDSEQDDRNPAFGVTGAGTVIMAYMRQASYAEDRKYTPEIQNSDVCVVRSEDGGLSWTAPEYLDRETYPHLSPFGRIITLSNGTVLMPVYTAGGSPELGPGSYFITSDDDGKTWSEPKLVAKDMNEVSIIELPNGELLAATRETAREHQRLWTCRSSDLGETWSEVELVTDDRQHPADLVLIDETTLLLLYGNRQGPYRIEGKVSKDNGKTWLPETLALSGHLYGYDMPEPRSTDLGYPSAVVVPEENKFVATYYVCPFPRVREHREWTGAGTTPFYSPEGYMGISLSVDLEELRTLISSYR